MEPHQVMHSDYMAHGFCLNWENSLVVLHVASDIVTGIAYYSIPTAMFYFAYRRRDLPFFKLFMLFALFIFSCGTTHFFAAYTIFDPIYWTEGYVKAFTAIVSALTALLFIPRIPEAIALPSVVSTLAEVKKLNSELSLKNAALQITNFSIEKVYDPIYWIAEDATIKRVNQAACSSLGYTRQEMLGFTISDVDPHYPKERWPDYWKELKEKGTLTFETQHRTREGRIRDMEVSSNYICTEGQEFCCAVVRDITERLRAEAALQKLNEELEMRVGRRTEELEIIQEQLKLHNAELATHNRQMQEAHLKLELETAERIRILEDLRHKEQLLIQQSRLAAMGEMLVNISHQWRQPLNVVGLKIQELGLSCKYGRFSEELLDGNIAETMAIVQHMSQTINDLQEFLSPNKEKTPFRVDQVITKTVGLIKENFKSLGISIELSSVGEPQVIGYPNEYGQVLLNLLMNAKDAFVEHGASGACITVRAWSENGRSLVTIADNAGGIKEDILAKIFDAYFTTKELGKGTGVGLFLSKTIIEANMGGRLSARNINGGAEFTIEV